jgi:hypothetical protein
MFGFFKTVKETKAAQNALTAAFEARGYMPFMTLDNTIHDALVREAMATGVEATVDHFAWADRSMGDLEFIEHYKERSKKFRRRFWRRRARGFRG